MGAGPCIVSGHTSGLPDANGVVGKGLSSGHDVRWDDYASLSRRGGARAGRASGTSVGRPRCRKMRSVTADSSRSPIKRSRPPQREHARTSKPKARRIRSAHREPGRGPDGSAVSAGVSVALVSTVTAGVWRRTTSARHAARGARTPWYSVFRHQTGQPPVPGRLEGPATEHTAEVLTVPRLVIVAEDGRRASSSRRGASRGQSPSPVTGTVSVFELTQDPAAVAGAIHLGSLSGNQLRTATSGTGPAVCRFTTNRWPSRVGR